MKPYGLDLNAVMREIVGVDSSSDNSVTSIISEAGKLAQKSAAVIEQQRSMESQLSKAITADVTWAVDEATLTLAVQSGDQNRVAAAHALTQSAASEAMAAGASLPPDAVQKRVAAAREAARQAAVDALVSPRDAGKQANMRAWQKVLNTVSTGSAMVPFTPPPSTSFLSKVVAGVPVWGWGLGFVGVVGGTVLIIRAFKTPKRRR